MLLLSKNSPSIERARISEWILGIGLALWGIVVWAHPQLFNIESYGPLSTVMDHESWTALVFVLSILRIATLVLDRLVSRLPHLRALGAIGGLTVWGSLFSVSAMYFSTRPTGLVVYGMLLTFEFLALWWAAGDAKVADRTE